jgi:hypothetical protein
MTTQTNGRRIMTHEATVKTAVVEIKSLQISGKQVTLAVFRQLQSGVLIDWKTQTLRGVPWGRVNYHALCLDTHYHEEQDVRWRDHLHVVWQEGDELRQDVIPRWPQLDDGLTRDEKSAFLEQWTVRYHELSQLDQLFIAV